MSPLRLGDRVRGVTRDRMVVNSALMFSTTVLMALSGAIFWVIAARLRTPEEVGIAGSLVAASVTLSYVAQMGLNMTLIKVIPRSTHPRSDVVSGIFVTAVAGGLLATAYVLALPVVSPRLAQEFDGVWRHVVFALLIAATSVNLLTDGVFLALDRLRAKLVINGVLMSLVKCALPFALAGGAFGLFGAVGGATVVAAAVSVVLLLRTTSGPLRPAPSRELRDHSKFNAAGYVTQILDMLPQLVLPVLVINAQGAAAGAVFFVGFQITTFLNSALYSIGGSMYAEAERSPATEPQIARKGAKVMAATSLAGAAVIALAAPLLLGVFGSHYSDRGALTLQVLAFSGIGVAWNCWSTFRLRFQGQLAAMMLVQTATSTLLLVLALTLAPHGVQYVAASWGVSHLFGGVVGFVVVETIRRNRLAAAASEQQT